MAHAQRQARWRQKSWNRKAQLSWGCIAVHAMRAWPSKVLLKALCSSDARLDLAFVAQWLGVSKQAGQARDPLQNPRQAGWTRIGTRRKASFAVNSRSY